MAPAQPRACSVRAAAHRGHVAITLHRQRERAHPIHVCHLKGESAECEAGKERRLRANIAAVVSVQVELALTDGKKGDLHTVPQADSAEINTGAAPEAEMALEVP